MQHFDSRYIGMCASSSAHWCVRRLCSDNEDDITECIQHQNQKSNALQRLTTKVISVQIIKELACRRHRHSDKEWNCVESAQCFQWHVCKNYAIDGLKSKKNSPKSQVCLKKTSKLMPNSPFQPTPASIEAPGAAQGKLSAPEPRPYSHR